MLRDVSQKLEVHLKLYINPPSSIPKRTQSSGSKVCFLDVVGTVYHPVIYMQSNKIHKVL